MTSRNSFGVMDEVQTEIKVTEKWIDQNRIKADVSGFDGQHPHNINVDIESMKALAANQSYSVTLKRGDVKKDSKYQNLTYGYFWTLSEIHQAQKPEEKPIAVPENYAPVISAQPRASIDWREAAAVNTQLSIQRQQLIVFANNILTNHDEIQIKIGKVEGIATTVNDRVKRIVSIAQILEPYFETGFQEITPAQDIKPEDSNNLEEELFPPLNDALKRTPEELRALLDLPNLNDMDKR